MRFALNVASRTGYFRRTTDPAVHSPLEIPPHPYHDLNNFLYKLIVLRAIIFLVGLNLADPLGLLPTRFGIFPFLPFFNLLILFLTASLLAIRLTGWQLQWQLYVQIGIDLCLTTVLVARTRGVDSAFVSLYILIIIYCGLTLGRKGGMAAAALSTIFYASVIAASQIKVIIFGSASADWQNPTYRISAHALAFFAVAFLGTSLSERLHAVQQELEEKILSLNRLQRLNEHIVSSIRSGLITTDLDGKIAVLNAAAAELAGIDSTGAMGKHVQSLLGDSLWSRMKGADYFKSARPLRHESWISVPGGGRKFLGFSVSPLMDPERQLLGYIISFQDLTEIKRLEEEVRLKDRMATIGRMAAGIAHEIRNPLTAMRGSVEILRSRANPSKPDVRVFDILIHESDRLNRFLEDFLHFAQPGKYPKAPVDLVSLLRDSVTLLENSPDVRGRHRIVLNLEARQIQVMGNTSQLQQVFWNLSQNAIRAMPDGGTLTIAARETEDGCGEIQFEDTGIGMTQEEMDQLFQPFQSGFPGGAGLGLGITFQIIEDHRGKVAFESVKGEGTTVTLRFPLERKIPNQPTIQ